MGIEDAVTASVLARQLFSDTGELEARLQASSDIAHLPDQGISTLEQCNAWPAVCGVLDTIADSRLPTLVYGDYDVDGVVSTFLLFRWLRSHGVSGNCFIPSRLRHGYGLNGGVISQAVEQGYKALVVLDCGTTNIEEIRVAREGGLEVVIIDHHERKDILPDAPLLNHHIDSELEPYCTAGLVYHVLQALRRRHGEPAESDEIELVGLATIADVVPLTPANWALAHHGLRAMPETTNLGLSELIKVSKLHGLTRLTSRQAAFNIIPRMNAAGRIRSADLVLKLLQCQDPSQARDLALNLEQINTERRRISDQGARSAILQAEQFPNDHGLALYDSQWHPGILGIVAARVAEMLGKPTAILTDGPLRPDILTGSVRTFAGINLVAALEQCSDSLVSFGGHSAAAGIKVQAERLDEFRSRWSAALEGAQRQADELNAGQLARIGLGELTEQFEKDIWRLAPFGPGHPAPRCVLTGCRVERVSYMGRDKTHLNIMVSDGQRQVRIAGFNQSHLFDRLSAGTVVEPIIEFEPDNWNNRYTIMLRLLGLMEQYATPGIN